MGKKDVREQVVGMEGLSAFEFGGSGTIQKMDTENHHFELLARIKDVDLFSKEVVYCTTYTKSFI